MISVPKLFASEPVRVVEYSLLTALAAALVTKGAVSADASGYLLAALAGLLGVPAVEVTRAKVTPWPKPDNPAAGR